MQLALGTVQFGLVYGVAGRPEAIPPAEARAILARAWDFGIRVLDTASAYGDIEARLDELCGDLDFGIVSKIPPVPVELGVAEGARWVVAQATQSHRRLGGRMRALMFHRAEDLTGPRGAALWSALAAWGDAQGVKLGASCYDPAMLANLQAMPGFEIAQVPGNVLDQRVADESSVDGGLDLHLRSALLQGLLVMEIAEATRKVPQSAAALVKWHEWLRERNLDALPAALSIVKSFTSVDCCVIGVDRLEQLEQIAEAWSMALPVDAPELRCDRLDVIDPRLWSKS